MNFEWGVERFASGDLQVAAAGVVRRPMGSAVMVNFWIGAFDIAFDIDGYSH